MSFGILGLVPGRSAVFLAAVLCISSAGRGAIDGHSVESVDGSDLTGAASSLLGLRACRLAAISVDPTPGVPLTVAVPLGDSEYILELSARSVRADKYELLVQVADGSYETAAPGPVRTLSGAIAGRPQSQVAASLLDDGLHAVIILPDGTRYWLEPLGPRVPQAGADQYVVYRDVDVIPSGGGCIAKDAVAVAGMKDVDGESGAGGVAGGALHVAELACDADFEYFQTYGSVEAAQNQIESIVHVLNTQYRRDVGILHEITSIIVRTGEPDPYSTTNPEGLLNQFTSQWANNHADVQRDVAQLFTGKNMIGSTIGIAWRPGICNSMAYSVVESNCCGSMACKTDLSAHELGHNWSAYHCPCPGHTMNAALTCANRFHENFDIPGIVAYRNSRQCLGSNNRLLRVLIDGPTEITENTTASYTATAYFTVDPPEDVTSTATWDAAPPGVGTITPDGLFTASELTSDVPATITAVFTDARGTDLHVLPVTVRNVLPPILGSIPPSGAVDARQPSDIDGTQATGWQSVDVLLLTTANGVSVADFTITEDGGDGIAPSVVGLVPVSGTSLRLLFNEPIEPAAWTVITYRGDGTSIRLGYLPADVNGDGQSGPLDILALIDALNGVGQPRALWSTDVNRSNLPEAGDILRQIDLLNGAGSLDAWNGRELP